MSISCETSTETMSMCVHGVPVKFECGRCEDKHRLNLLESQVKSLTDMYKYISSMVAGFEGYRIRQIDDNSKMSKRVDELEDFNKRQIDWNKHINERIEKLESNATFNRDNRDDLNSALGCIQTEYKKMIDNHASVINNCVDRLNEIEEKISEKYAHPDVITRLERLEKYKSLIDYLNNNRNDWRDPINKNEHLIEHAQDGIEKCFERIEKLENSSFEDMKNELICFKKQRNEIKERLDKLEMMYKIERKVERIAELESKLEDIIPRVWSSEQKGCVAIDYIENNGKFKNKTPHKCPVCDGSGKVKEKLSSFVNGKEILCDCKSCEGKGIVWG